MESSEEKCLYCEKSSELVPLIPLVYQGGKLFICPQHLPILIHKPEQLANRLPGTEHWGKAVEPHGHS